MSTILYLGRLERRAVGELDYLDGLGRASQVKSVGRAFDLGAPGEEQAETKARQALRLLDVTEIKRELLKDFTQQRKCDQICAVGRAIHSPSVSNRFETLNTRGMQRPGQGQLSCGGCKGMVLCSARWGPQNPKRDSTGLDFAPFRVLLRRSLLSV